MVGFGRRGLHLSSLRVSERSNEEEMKNLVVYLFAYKVDIALCQTNRSCKVRSSVFFYIICLVHGEETS